MRKEVEQYERGKWVMGELQIRFGNEHIKISESIRFPINFRGTLYNHDTRGHIPFHTVSAWLPFIRVSLFILQERETQRKKLSFSILVNTQFSYEQDKIYNTFLFTWLISALISSPLFPVVIVIPEESWGKHVILNLIWRGSMKKVSVLTRYHMIWYDVLRKRESNNNPRIHTQLNRDT